MTQWVAASISLIISSHAIISRPQLSPHATTRPMRTQGGTLEPSGNSITNRLIKLTVPTDLQSALIEMGRRPMTVGALIVDCQIIIKALTSTRTTVEVMAMGRLGMEVLSINQT